MQPGNAEYWDARARLDFVTMESVSGSSQSLSDVTTATRLAPFVSRYWLDLALISLIHGDQAGQRKAIERAIAVDPTSPDVAWAAGNFYLINNDIEKALEQFHVFVQHGRPQQQKAALDLCWKATGDVDRILQKVVGNQGDAHIALLLTVVEAGNADAALRVWRSIQKGNYVFQTEQVYGLVDLLLKRQDMAVASEVWQQATGRRHDPGNLIENAGFEEELLNAGFDWRFTSDETRRAQVSSSESHSGSRSILISFSGAAADGGITQLVPASPSTRYVLTLFVKSRDIESKSLPFIAVVDPDKGQLLANAEPVASMTGWNEIRLPFTTGPSTRLVAMKVLRNAEKLPIRGELYLDDVVLNRVGAATQ